MAKKFDKKRLAKRLLRKYRLVILNEDTFEERFAYRLKPLNVFVVTAIFTILLITATTILIAFTPLREYIPGYSSITLKKKATILNYKTDSLQKVIAKNERYLESIKKVLTGDVSMNEINTDSLKEDIKIDVLESNLVPNQQDSILRAKVDKEDKYNVFETVSSKTDFVLFPPVSGSISEGFNAKKKHYAVDIVVAKNTPIKAVADGTVIFAEWTIETGFVLIIEHSNGLISVYKHNASLIKQQGDLVKTGEIIATAGNTGEFSTGPHLHFELWSKGYPLNPTNFIDF